MDVQVQQAGMVHRPRKIAERGFEHRARLEAILNRTPWRMWDLRTGEPAPGAGTIGAPRLLEAIAKLLDVIIWPAALIYVLSRFGSNIGDFGADTIISKSSVALLVQPMAPLRFVSANGAYSLAMT
ncbi:MAG: hypothetical protein WBQ75_08240 [Acetobacteraceae bacterium]